MKRITVPAETVGETMHTHTRDRAIVRACAYALVPCNWCKQRTNSEWYSIREQTGYLNAFNDAMMRVMGRGPVTTEDDTVRHNRLVASGAVDCNDTSHSHWRGL